MKDKRSETEHGGAKLVSRSFQSAEKCLSCINRLSHRRMGRRYEIRCLDICRYIPYR
jgi:hypothetical protein